ncbi:MAG: TIGR02206 family membrane protein [Acidobacteriia bacterium]|nr:TIGR02206 family membrane protein [Terriglobia bacterium]
MMEFRTFGPQHLTVLLILLALGILVAWGGSRLRGKTRIRFGWALGFLLLGYALALYLQEAMMGGLHGSYSLPMQLCDWVLIACLVTLIRPNVLASEIAYFWGLGGTLQAVLTPDVTTGFPSWRFIQFFWGHGITLLCIVYIIVAQHFRPRPRSVLRMMIAVNIYGLSALGLDLAFGWNYGFLLHKPAEPSLLDYLGPWPWYLISAEILGLASFLLLALPWKILDGIRAGKQTAQTGINVL